MITLDDRASFNAKLCFDRFELHQRERDSSKVKNNEILHSRDSPEQSNIILFQSIFSTLTLEIASLSLSLRKCNKN